LVIEKEILLLQALTGVDFVITHLDGRKIRIKNNPGEIIKHDEIKVVEGMGMPFHKRVFNYGNLFVHFKVKFPDTLDANSMELLASALSNTGLKKQSTGGKKDEKTDEVVEMKKFEEFHKNLHHGGGDKGNDSEEEEDDEGHGHGQRVGCQTQ